MKVKILVGLVFSFLPVFLLAQAQNWAYYESSPGMAKQIIACNNGVTAVGSASTNSAGVFTRIYGAQGRDENGWCVQQTPDSGFIMLGWYSPGTAILIKTDIRGDTSWIHDVGNCQGEYIRQTADKGYVLTGVQNSHMFLTRTDSLGSVRWTKTYDYQMGHCVSLTQDLGFIITGVTNDGMSLALVKTDSAGNQAWSKVYSAPNQSSGNYVEQTSDQGYILSGFYGAGGMSFYAWLLKTNASGDTLWTKKYYDGVTIGFVSHQTADGGYILGTVLLFTNKIWVLKTDALGDSIWTQRIEAYGSGYCDLCEVPGSGYAVAGTTTANDVSLWRLNNQGAVTWSSSYGGPDNDFTRHVIRTMDQGYAIIGNSNSFGAGDYDIYFVRTDSLGRKINEDLTIMSFNTSGDTRWLYQYDGPGKRNDIGYTLTEGLDGNLYAGGFSQDSTNTYHSTVVSVDSSGNYRWSYVHPIGASSLLLPDQDNTCVVYGLDGNIYVSGYEVVGSRGIILCFNNQGALNWTYHRNNVVIGSLVYGADGNLYATGFEADTITYQHDFLILSVSSGGSERWVYHKDVGDADQGAAILYRSNNLYACGSLGSAGWFNFACISVDNQGNERWVYSRDAGSEDHAYSLTGDSDGNLYVAGGSGDPMTMDWTVVKIDTMGNEKWVYDYNGPNNSDDWAYNIAFGADGNLYTAGWSESSLNHPDLTVVCVDTAGSEKWNYRASPGWGWSIIQGSDQNIYTCGDGWFLESGKGFSVICLRPPVSVEETSNDKHAETGDPFLSVSPNPFSSHGDTRFTVHVSRNLNQDIFLGIFDATGRLVQNLTSHVIWAMKNQTLVVAWNGTDDRGHKLSAGVYFCQLKCGEKETTQKLIMIR
jgi:hypothetical protein